MAKNLNGASDGAPRPPPVCLHWFCMDEIKSIDLDINSQLFCNFKWGHTPPPRTCVMAWHGRGADGTEQFYIVIYSHVVQTTAHRTAFHVIELAIPETAIELEITYRHYSVFFSGEGKRFQLAAAISQQAITALSRRRCCCWGGTALPWRLKHQLWGNGSSSSAKQ